MLPLNCDGSSDSQKSKQNNKTQKSKNKKNDIYIYDSHVAEQHGKAVYGVTFNPWMRRDGIPVMATAGSNRCSIYEFPKEGGIKFVQCYSDPDPDEVFYTCAWSINQLTREPLLAMAGCHGVIRVVNVHSNTNIANLDGHGQAINELKFHPRQYQLLLSASKDYGIRLWNIETDVCIAIFGGTEGHRDEVLSIDFDAKGHRIMSSGMDHALKMWCINTEEFRTKIDLSNDGVQIKQSKVSFPTIMQHYPDYSTRDIHRNYVDCVQWFGDYLLSKSCDNMIVCWKPGELHQKLDQLKRNDSTSTTIAELEYDDCKLWFVRFGINLGHNTLALGTQLGHVYVWELFDSDVKNARMTTLCHPRCKTTVRQVAFSRDAQVLVCVCDDGTVWRWNRNNKSIGKGAPVDTEPAIVCQA